METLRACRHAPRRQGDAQGEVVDVVVGWGGSVGDGGGEAVVVTVVVGGGGGGFEAGGPVEGVVGEEAVVGLADDGVLAVVVVGAGGGGA